MLVRKSCSLSQQNVDIQQEFANLARFRDCLSINDRIMTSLGSVFYSNTLHIFFRPADFDLDDFLYDKKHSEDIATYPVSPIHLMHEVAGLANALDYLHDGLHLSNGEHVICVHHDIKPDNILVFPDPRAPVGRWKIADFGISRLKKAHSNSDDHAAYPYYHVHSVTASLTIPKRPMGSFQAPEVERQTERVVGPKSDVWSLGCVLCLVLAYAIGGTSYVKKLDETRQRRKEELNRSTSYADDYYYRDSSHTLKPEIETWLREFCDTTKPRNSWVKPCTSIITAMLSTDPRERPTAKWVENELYNPVVRELKEGAEKGSAEKGSAEKGSAEKGSAEKGSAEKGSPKRSSEPSRLERKHVEEHPLHVKPRCTSTSVVLNSPPQEILQTALSLISGMVIFLSNPAVYVYSIDPGEGKIPRSKKTSLTIPAPDGHIWRSMAISGMNLALRGSTVEPGDDTVSFDLTFPNMTFLVAEAVGSKILTISEGSRSPFKY